MLNQVRIQIFESIKDLVCKMGGKVCIRHYQEWDTNHDRYAFFDIDCDGHGIELFADTVVYDPDAGIHVLLHDTEDCYEQVWALDEFNASNALYLHDELEMVANYLKETGEDVVQEYDPDYVPENW